MSKRALKAADSVAGNDGAELGLLQDDGDGVAQTGIVVDHQNTVHLHGYSRSSTLKVRQDTLGGP